MSSTQEHTAAEIKQVVKEKYGAIATRVGTQTEESCCGPDDGCGCSTSTISDALYESSETEGLPPDAVTASLGCGNPTALATLEPGETVLDLGSGGGIDVLLSARRVGPDGFVYGLDMTDEMLALARRNQQQAGVDNVEFLKGEIEAIPLPDASVHVIISNCVINLSADKTQVLSEAYRVLRPGGRLAVSDVVRRRDVTPELQRDMELWTGCIAGALHEVDYRSRLEQVGFTDVEIEPTRMIEADGELDGAYMSAFIRATKR